MINLEFLQDEHFDWANHNFGGSNADHALFGMTEELGELAHAHLKQLQGIRENEGDFTEQAKDSVADIVIYMINYCNARGFNLEKLIQTTWDHVKKRDWKKFPGNGVSE